VHADLAEILRAGLRAKELVKQILTFSRRTEQNVQSLLVQPIVKESLKLLRASLPTMIELRQKIAEECGMVLADPTQIHQVVMNLCTNAYQSMRGKGGVLGVAMAPVELGQADVANKMALKPGNYVRLSISDTGSGIAPEILEHIFEPYFTTKKKGEGTGLGLSVVHGIVQGLGGHVSVYSEPGQGTTFHIYLPVLPSQTDIPPVGAVTEAQIPTGTERVLLLDDEKGVVATEQRILTGLGYTVRGFTSCTEAMDEFLRHSDAYDLIITDMNMPKVSGAELAEAVRAVRPDIPIIMCTGFSEIMNEEKARQLGINRLIMKPLTLKELAQNVRGVLDAAR
jgi:CheY-like chemotaxis protein